MHFVFVDIMYQYATDRPELDEPLGGTTSAVCFLAQEFLKLGIRSTLVNLTSEPREALGIPAYPFAHLDALCRDPSVSGFIFCGRWDATLVQSIRKITRKPLIAWMHESMFDGGVIAPLPDFDGVVFVSDWQTKINRAHILFRWQTTVIRNAMNPRFAAMFGANEPILPAKNRLPILLYAGDFQRGVFHVPPILKALCPQDDRFTAELYTNTQFSPDAQFDKQYFADISAMPNVSHIGKVGQGELVKRMKRAALLLMPNPWPETSCINLIQAMASGMLCVVTDRAALPETACGFARLSPCEERDEPVQFNMSLDHELFAAALANALREWRGDQAALEEKLQKQRAYFLTEYQWASRALAWVDYIKRFA